MNLPLPPQAGADSVLVGTCSLPLPGTLVPELPAGGGSRVASPSPSVASPKAVLPTSPHAAIPAYDDNAQSLVRAGDGVLGQPITSQPVYIVGHTPRPHFISQTSRP